MVLFLIIAGPGYLSANGSPQPLQNESDYNILYHESLNFRFEGSATQPSSRSSASGGVETTGEKSTTLSFDAFGQRFELELESNQALIAKLPQRQRQALNEQLKIYRGRLRDNENSWARITRQGDRISGMIWDGAEMFVIDHSTDVSQALQQNNRSGSGYPLIYRLADTETSESRCALDPSSAPINDYEGLSSELQANVRALPQATSQLDIAIIADTQFVAINSNPDAAVIGRMNVVDGIFSDQVGVHLNVSEIRALQNNGGLTSNSAGTLLTQLANFSNSSGFNNPGLAHLFTGRNLTGSTIGIAYLSSLCSDRFGVGISETRGGGVAGALTVAHELGHNFGAPHDNQSGSACGGTSNGFIMNPSLNGSDQFSQCSLSQMQPEIQSARCLTAIDTTPSADVRPVLPQNPIRASIDQAFDLQIEVQNSGNTAAVNAAASISVPQQLAIQTANTSGGNCSIATNNVSCDLDNIGSNASKTITIRLLAGQSGSFVSTAEVSADNDGNVANNTVEAAISISDVDVGGLFEAHFDSDSDGFTYIDDAFRNTNQPNYADGVYSTTEGFRGGGLRILIGGRDNADIRNISGGWERSFNLQNPESVTLEFRYRFAFGRHHEADEYSEAVVSVDGILLERNGVDYLTRFRGDGNGGPTMIADWQVVTFNLGELSAGTHSIQIGAFNNKKTYNNEATLIFIDDVVVSRGTVPAPPTAQCPAGARFANDGQGLNFCWFEDLPLPDGAQPLCYLLNSRQLIGYYFDINLTDQCPATARRLTNGRTLNFCIFDNIEVPPGAVAECDEMTTNRRIGYSFPE